MSYFDEDVFNEEYLSPEDRKIVEEIRYTKEKIINDNNVEDYVKQYIGKCNGGAAIEGFVKEILSPFASYLRELIDYHISGMIIDKIEGYSEEDYLRFKEEGAQRIAERRKKGEDPI